MAVNSFVLFNQKYYYKTEFSLNYNNRSFYYGDALFETMHANGTEIQFFDDHLIRLKYGMQVLKMNIPENFEDGMLKKEIIKLLHKNKLFQGVRIRLSVFRDAEGKYTPAHNNISYLVETSHLEYPYYQLNQKGFTLETFKDIYKPLNIFSNLKTSNSLVFIMAGIFAKEKNVDDCIILNENGHPTETISSNLFCIKDQTISTPSLNEGPVAGIMRKQILRISNSLGFKVNYKSTISKQELLNADEVFLTNTINGIRWVLAYEDKRFFNQKVKLLINKLNEISFGISS
ncbi:MAG: aminotransferase class IV [Bacteroidales bacterium]|nr:aminotransferase class IV [Bacteroidales bacterium]